MRSDISRQHRILQLIEKYTKRTARQLADELEVSTKTIYRDLNDLTLALYPIITERGRYDGGIGFMEGYRLTDKIMTLSQHVLLEKALSTYPCNTKQEQDDLDVLMDLFHLSNIGG